ncbi:hypothetical protein [Candidatus Lokiarchaeum ossiferum]|uniref:hypothetical protein n=1 Tax=Candidatus Lokiarchaeum ossiferum TaxID=2951803 RepID=UPI00352EDC89
MKADCTNCKRQYDETEWSQFVSFLPSIQREKYFTQQLCPECYKLQHSMELSQLKIELSLTTGTNL